MKSFIVINHGDMHGNPLDPLTYPIDTDAERVKAWAAMEEFGLASLPIWRGDSGCSDPFKDPVARFFR